MPADGVEDPLAVVPPDHAVIERTGTASMPRGLIAVGRPYRP
jgi:hypothetical protein